MNTTWLISTGLRRHGFSELAAKLDSDLVALAQRSGFREYFNPVTGSGHGTHRFSWTAAIVLHILRSRSYLAQPISTTSRPVLLDHSAAPSRARKV